DPRQLPDLRQPPVPADPGRRRIPAHHARRPGRAPGLRADVFALPRPVQDRRREPVRPASGLSDRDHRAAAAVDPALARSYPPPAPFFPALLATALYLLPVVAVAAFALARMRDPGEPVGPVLAAAVPAGAAVDLMLILTLARVVRVDVAVLVSRGLWVVVLV